MDKKNFTCPCCGYNGLEIKPYENMPDPPIHTADLKPPYLQHWGKASYDICVCCGFEYGLDDEPGGEFEPSTFEAYLQNWVQVENCKWFDIKLRPLNWNIAEQLKNADMSVPAYILDSKQLPVKK
ncbi:MAG: hypothetical protein ABL927_07970 [Bdellovibrionales bacterium]